MRIDGPHSLTASSTEYLTYLPTYLPNGELMESIVPGDEIKEIISLEQEPS